MVLEIDRLVDCDWINRDRIVTHTRSRHQNLRCMGALPGSVRLARSTNLTVNLRPLSSNQISADYAITLLRLGLQTEASFNAPVADTGAFS